MRHERASRTGLSIRVSNGKIIHERVAAETFILALKELGLERVRSLNKKFAGTALVSKHKHENYQQHRIGGYYVLTHTSTRVKKQLLEEIAAELGVAITVEIIK